VRRAATAGIEIPAEAFDLEGNVRAVCN